MESALDYYRLKIADFESMTYEQRRAVVAERGLTDKFHTKATLKELFRVKPVKGAVSEYQYPNPYGRGQIECFTIAQCCAMRSLPASSVRTAAQIAAADKLAIAARKNSGQYRAALLAKEMIESGEYVVIDTETVDLHRAVIQIALVDVTTAAVIYTSRVYSDEPIADAAFEKHGLRFEDIKDAPTFEEVAKQIAPLLQGKKWTAFNRTFDQTCLHYSSKGATGEWFDWIATAAPCAMINIAVPAFGPTNRHGTISLATTLDLCGLSFDGAAHQAHVDAVATAKMIHHISTLADAILGGGE